MLKCEVIFLRTLSISLPLLDWVQSPSTHADWHNIFDTMKIFLLAFYPRMWHTF